MFNVNNKDTRRRRSGIFIVNFEHISYLILVFLLLTFFRTRFVKDLRPGIFKYIFKANPDILDSKRFSDRFRKHVRDLSVSLKYTVDIHTGMSSKLSTLGNDNLQVYFVLDHIFQNHFV